MIDHTPWRLVEEFTLEEAACLWCDVAPSTNGMETLARRQEFPATFAIEQMLQSEVGAGRLEVQGPGKRAPFVGSNPILHRDDLKRLAIEKEVRPKFLFPAGSAAASLAERDSTHSQHATEEGDETPLYRSPFVDLILRAEQHFGESIREIKSDEIFAWLMEEGPKIDPNSNWTETKARYMTTFLRHPDQQKGGAKRSKGQDH